MPFFRSVEPAARNLRPLAGHRLVVPPVLTPAVASSSERSSRFAGRTPLIGGVAVLAVAGALSAGLGGSRQQAVPTSPATVAAPASEAVTSPPSDFDALLTPAAYIVTVKAPAAAHPAVKLAVTATKAHSPSLSSKANAPRGASVVTHQDTVNVKAMTSQLRRLRTCESGGNYHEASGNGYWGAYQFDVSTWHSLGLQGYPSNASHQLQDVAVTRLQARKGWGPWPVCSYVAGLR